jgi:hypothetical protein
MADFWASLSPLKVAAASGPDPSPIVVAAEPAARYLFAGGFAIDDDTVDEDVNAAGDDSGVMSSDAFFGSL